MRPREPSVNRAEPHKRPSGRLSVEQTPELQLILPSAAPLPLHTSALISTMFGELKDNLESPNQ